MARNYLLYLALRLGAVVLPRLPLALAYRLADGAGSLAYLLAPGARRGITSNLAVAIASTLAERRRRLARSAFRTNARNWLDTLRIRTLPVEAVANLAAVEGWQQLEEALSAGHGLILISMHLGNFDLVGQLIAARGYQLTVPVEEVHPERLLRFLTEQRESQGVHTVPVDRAPRAMIRALSRGEIVGLTADRLVGGKGLEVAFFDRPTLFPAGPASLARHSGAPVFFGLGLRSGNGYTGQVRPVPVVRTANGRVDERQIMQDLALIMEESVRAHPDQWLAFSPLWPPRPSRSTTGTMKQESEAAV